jgi:hypothetical protein
MDSQLSSSEWHSRNYQSAKKLGSEFYRSVHKAIGKPCIFAICSAFEPTVFCVIISYGCSI